MNYADIFSSFVFFSFLFIFSCSFLYISYIKKVNNQRYCCWTFIMSLILLWIYYRSIFWGNALFIRGKSYRKWFNVEKFICFFTKKKKNLCVNNIVVDAEIRVAYSFSKCTFKDSKRTWPIYIISFLASRILLYTRSYKIILLCKLSVFKSCLSFFKFNR